MTSKLTIVDDTDGYISLEQLLAPDIEERDIDVPEWGGKVRVRAFSKGQMQELRDQSTIAGQVDGDRLEILMLVHGVVRPEGLTPGHYELLRQKSVGVFNRVAVAINDLCGFGKMEADKGDFREES